jgi:hypothetical protein
MADEAELISTLTMSGLAHAPSLLKFYHHSIQKSFANAEDGGRLPAWAALQLVRFDGGLLRPILPSNYYTE